MVVAECLVLAGANAEHPLHRLAGYLENRQEQLDYAAACQEGLPIGSGMVERGHRTVIQARLKLPGAWWKEETVDPMLALRTLRGQRPVGSLLALTPTGFSHTPGCHRVQQSTRRTCKLDAPFAGGQGSGAGVGREHLPGDGAPDPQKNELKPWKKKEWCIPKLSGEVVARMEDVLDLLPPRIRPGASGGVF